MTLSVRSEVDRFIGPLARSILKLAVREMLCDGGIAIDVGAGSGWFAWAAGKYVGPKGRAYIFEPDAERWTYLKLEAQRRGLANVACVRVALSDHNGYRASGPHRAPTSRLDTYHFTQRIAAIKLTPDDHEAEILLGAKSAIETHRPYLVVHRNSLAATGDLFRGLGYDPRAPLLYGGLSVICPREKHFRSGTLILLATAATLASAARAG